MDEKLEIVRSLTGLATKQDAARYVLAKGIESMNTPIQAQAMLKQLSDKYSPEEMLPLFEKLDQQKE